MAIARRQCTKMENYILVIEKWQQRNYAGLDAVSVELLHDAIANLWAMTRVVEKVEEPTALPEETNYDDRLRS